MTLPRLKRVGFLLHEAVPRLLVRSNQPSTSVLRLGMPLPRRFGAIGVTLGYRALLRPKSARSFTHRARRWKPILLSSVVAEWPQHDNSATNLPPTMLCAQNRAHAGAPHPTLARRGLCSAPHPLSVSISLGRVVRTSKRSVLKSLRGYLFESKMGVAALNHFRAVSGR